MRTESWTDLGTGRRRTLSTMDGKPVFESVSGQVDGKAQINILNYRVRTWTTFIPGIPASRGQTLVQYAQHFRDGVANGFYKSLGQETLDGRATVHLRHSTTLDTPVGKHTVTTDLWVDALTYLPVVQKISSGGTTSSASETDYDWLPRTAANLAKLDLVVPDGFRHVEQSPTSCSTSSSGSWLTFSLGGTTTSCSFQIATGHP